jgi:APA family basic amino acid/polyamine antiporter
MNGSTIEDAPPTSRAVRVLGMLDASFIVTGSILGAGIFFVSKDVAESVGSPVGYFAVWIAGGLIALAGALSNGELASMYPRSGGEYVFLREAYSPALGFLSGWTSFWIAFPGSIATLAAGFALSVGDLLHFPPGSVAGTVVSIGAVVALTIVNSLGLRPGKWTQNILSSAKLVAFALLLLVGMLSPAPDGGHFTPFFGGGDTPRGLGAALIPVLFAYSGWNAAAYVTGEIRDAKRNLGRALVLGTGVCMVLYVAMNAVYMKAMPLAQIAQTRPIAGETVMRLMGPAMRVPLTLLIATSVFSSLQASVLVGPRIYQAMAQDRIFFAPLAKLSPTTGSPTRALAAQCAVSCVLLLTGQFEQLFTFTIVFIELFSAMTVAGVIVLRIRRPQLSRGFRTPLYPVVPLAYVAAIGWVLISLLSNARTPEEQTHRLVAFIGLGIVAAGVPAYFGFRWLRDRSAPSG